MQVPFLAFLPPPSSGMQKGSRAFKPSADPISLDTIQRKQVHPSFGKMAAGAGWQLLHCFLSPGLTPVQGRGTYLYRVGSLLSTSMPTCCSMRLYRRIGREVKLML